VAYISLHIPSQIQQVLTTSTYSGMPFSSDSTCYMRSSQSEKGYGKWSPARYLKERVIPFLSKESQILKEPVSTPIGVNERMYTVYNSYCSVHSICLCLATSFYQHARWAHFTPPLKFLSIKSATAHNAVPLKKGRGLNVPLPISPFPLRSIQQRGR